MRPRVLVSCAALILLAGPLFGVWLAGNPIEPYLQFPPRPAPVAVPDFSWPFQPHTFTPLWLGYIGVVNALIVRRKGSSLMTRQPARYAALFPLSALFW